MTLSLKHTFTSAKSDGSDATLVQPSNWNAEHTILMATAKILGRATAGTGAVEEISVTGTGSVALADSPVFTTQATAPLLIGGSGAASTLTLESTSGAGTTDAIIFKTASQVERARIDTNGVVSIGGATATAAVAVGGLNMFGVGGGTVASGAASGTSHFVVGSYDTGSHGTNSNVYCGLNNFNNDGYGEFFSVTFGRGTYSSPTAVGGTDFIGGFKGNAYYNGSGSSSAVGSVEFFVDGSYSTGITAPGHIQIKTQPAGGSNVERMRIDSAGRLLIGNKTSHISNAFSDSAMVQMSDATCLLNMRRYANNAFGAYLNFNKSRGSAPTTNAAVQVGDELGSIYWSGYDSAGTPAQQMAASIGVNATAVASGSVSASMSLYTASTERMRIASAGNVYFPGVGTTASAANAFINNGSTPVNELLRSTSSLRYKKDVEPVDEAYRDAVLSISPIWYRSKAEADNPDHSFYGMAAEEVAAVDPRLVHWAYLEQDYETIETPISEDGHVRFERRVKQDAKLVPDAVMYDRVAILQIAALAAKVTALEARLAGPRN